MLRDHWSEADVARELRHGDEYRNKYRWRRLSPAAATPGLDLPRNLERRPDALTLG